MKRLAEERAVVFLYVMLAAAVMILVAPLLFNLTGTVALNDQMQKHETLATHLAVSGMEALMAYLDRYEEADGDRVAYLQAYPGFGTQAITLPEGTLAMYSLTQSGPVQGVYTITMSATVGEREMARTKTLVYQVTASAARSTTITTDPTKRVQVPPEPEQVYVQGRASGVPKEVIVRQDNALHQAIGQTIDFYQRQTLDQAAVYERQAVVCSCANADEISRAIDQQMRQTTHSPIILMMDRQVVLDGRNARVNWGSASRPVVLIFQDVTVNNSTQVGVVGDLIVKGNLTMNNQVSFDVQAVDGKFGDFSVFGTFTGNNLVTVSVDETLYAGEMKLNNKTLLQVGSLVVDRTIGANNNVEIQASRDLMAGEMKLNNNSEITSSAGDIFVEGDLQVNNNTDLTSGGVVAVGGDISINGKVTFQTGGASSSLIVSAPSGGGGSAGGWNPVRVN
jgi:hypothetical protein